MTLPEDTAAGPVVSSQRFGTQVTVRDAAEGDHIRAARTTRDGRVVRADNYALANKREAGKDVLGREKNHVVRPEDRKPIVTDWQGMEDYDECPPDYGTFFAQYQSYTTHLVWTMGVAPREIEDVVMEIMTRFMERDSLGEFRRDWATRSKTGTSVFRSYYSRFVVTYARGKHRNNVRFIKRYNLLCDAPVGDDKGTRWIDQHDARVSEHDGLSDSEAEFEGLVASLAAQVGPDVMAVVTDMVAESGQIKLTELASRLGISQRQARVTRNKLKAAAESVIGS